MSTPNVAIPQSEEPKAGVAGVGGGGRAVRQRFPETSRGGQSTARDRLLRSSEGS